MDTVASQGPFISLINMVPEDIFDAAALSPFAAGQKKPPYIIRYIGIPISIFWTA